MARSRHKQRHIQYTLDLIPTTILHLNNGIKLNDFDELWVKTFLTGKNTKEKNPFWVTISNGDFI